MVNNSSEYQKNYFEKNKDKIKKQMKESQKKYKIREIIRKLNNNEYSRIPYLKIDKYNIKQKEDGTYYL